MHIFIVPSFFFTNKTGAPHGELLGLIKPLSSNSCNCYFNSFNSVGAIRYGEIDIGFVPCNKSILNSISLSGANPGKSSGKTSEYPSQHVYLPNQ